jgi:hypothetical protein
MPDDRNARSTNYREYEEEQARVQTALQQGWGGGGLYRDLSEGGISPQTLAAASQNAAPGFQTQNVQRAISAAPPVNHQSAASYVAQTNAAPSYTQSVNRASAPAAGTVQSLNPNAYTPLSQRSPEQIFATQQQLQNLGLFDPESTVHNERWNQLFSGGMALPSFGGTGATADQNAKAEMDFFRTYLNTNDQKGFLHQAISDYLPTAVPILQAALAGAGGYIAANPGAFGSIGMSGASGALGSAAPGMAAGTNVLAGGGTLGNAFGTVGNIAGQMPATAGQLVSSGGFAPSSSSGYFAGMGPETISPVPGEFTGGIRYMPEPTQYSLGADKFSFASGTDPVGYTTHLSTTPSGHYSLVNPTMGPQPLGGTNPFLNPGYSLGADNAIAGLNAVTEPMLTNLEYAQGLIGYDQGLMPVDWGGFEGFRIPGAESSLANLEATIVDPLINEFGITAQGIEGWAVPDTWWSPGYNWLSNLTPATMLSGLGDAASALSGLFGEGGHGEEEMMEEMMPMMGGGAGATAALPPGYSETGSSIDPVRALVTELPEFANVDLQALAPINEPDMLDDYYNLIGVG